MESPIETLFKHGTSTYIIKTNTWHLHFNNSLTAYPVSVKLIPRTVNRTVISLNKISQSSQNNNNIQQL